MAPAHPGRAAASAGWNGHSHGSSDYRKLLAGLFFAGIATFAQLYSPQAVLAQIADDVGISAADAALVISASTLGLAIGVIPWSLVADRLGRVRAMSIAVIAATVFGLLVPFAPTFSLLLTGRFVEGLMVGGVPAIAIAYLSEEIEPRHAARAAGTYVAGTTIGGLLGRILAGPVTELTNWRVGVFTVGVLCAFAAVLFITLVPAPRGFVPRGFIPGGFLSGGFVRRPFQPRRASKPGTDLSLALLLRANLQSPRLLALYLQGFLLMGGFVALYNYLGFRFADDPFNLPQALISLVFVAYLAGTWSSVQAGILVARLGRWSVLLSSLACMTAGVLLTLSTVLVIVLFGVLLATSGFFAAHAVASGWTGAEAQVGRAQASSLYNLSYYAGSSLFGWLGGMFFVRWGWGGTVGMVAGLAVLAAAVAVVALRPQQRQS